MKASCRFLVLLFLGIVPSVLPAPAIAAVIGEFSVPEWPANLTADAAGNIWFSGLNGTTLRRITPSGTVTEFPLPTGRSFVYGGGLVVGSDGNIWFASATVIRSTPTGVMTQFTMPTGDVPYGMALGPDGNVWFTTGGGNWIGRITPAGTLTPFYVGALIGYAGTTGISAGPDGNLWFTTATYGGIGRITTSGVATSYAVPDESTAAYGGIVAGADGNMWFSDFGNSRIGRVTPQGVVTMFDVPSIRRGVNNITVGPDGNIWFQEDSGGKFGVIAPDGSLAELALLGVLSEGTGYIANFTTSPDGLIWYTHFIATKVGAISQSSVANFFPLTPSASWTYSLNGAGTVTRSVGAATVNIGGIDTSQMHTTGGTGTFDDYYTNDANGIRWHRETEGSDIVTFSPPVVNASAQSVLGTPTLSSGTASGTSSGSPFSLPYANSSLLQGIEVVSVPKGSFRSVKAQSTLSLNGTPISTETTWLSDHVGVVKSFDGANTVTLNGTSIANTVPDSFGYAIPAAAPPITPSSFTVSGTTASAPISISGGQYSIDGGAYTNAAGFVSNGQSVTVRPLAPLNALVRQAVVTVGGVTGVFHTLRRPGLAIDLDGDGRSDILWRNASSGEDFIFFMNGAAVGAGSNYTNAVPDPDWHIVGVGDFDGDGKADILWRNSATGENYVFLMNGTTVLAGSSYINSVPDQNWQVAGVGDFDGDGKADILWRNKVSGEDYIFFMDGIAVKAGSNYTNAVADQNWQVAGVADFDGDGRADVLWRNANSGEDYVFLMNGITVQAGSGYTNSVPGPDWKIAGVGDYDGDGKSDILWRNGATGEDFIFLMSATTVQAGSGYTNSVPDQDWKIVGTGDYDGDGRADILWRHASSGDNYVFLMNATVVQPGSTYTNSVPDLDWQVVAK